MEMEPFFYPSQDEALMLSDVDLMNRNFPSLLSDHFDSLPLDAFDCCDPAFEPLPPPLPPSLPPPRTSAFVNYVRPQWDLERKLGGREEEEKEKKEKENVHVRMVELLRRIPMARADEEVSEKNGDGSGGGGRGGVGSRCFRHMMRERQRRERLSQSYSDLYAMVSPRSKADKNSIVRSVAEYLRELKVAVEELRWRNEELQGRMREASERVNIRLHVGNPSSPVESMIGALQCLKGMQVKAKSITCSSRQRELSATIAIETKMAGREVEGAVQGALVEVEKKLRAQQQHQRNVGGWDGVPSRCLPHLY